MNTSPNPRKSFSGWIGRRALNAAGLAVALALGVWPAAVSAEVIFTFDVPIELSNLHPDFGRGKVVCDAAQFPATGFAGGSILTNGASAEFAITGGRYSGTVTVTMDDTFILPSRRASEANGYSCSLQLHNGRDWLERPGIERWGPPAAGTTPQFTVNGRFPGR